MKIEELNNEEMYAAFAPNGCCQVMTMAPDYFICLGLIKLLHKKGIGISYHEMNMKGYEILPIKVSIFQNGTEEEAFQRAKQSIK